MPLHKANKNKIKTRVTRSLNIIATRSLNIVATRSLNIIATRSLNIIATRSLNIIAIRSLNIIATPLAPIAPPLASIATRSIHSQTPIREKSQTANFRYATNGFALQCDEWLALQMRRMASLSNATNGFALQMRCNRFARSTNAM